MKSAAFLWLTCLFSWSILIGAHQSGVAPGSALAIAALTLSMFGVSLAAIFCALVLEREQAVEALGLRFSPNRWWLLAWLLPFAIAALAIGLTALLSGRMPLGPGQAAIADMARANPAAAEMLGDIPGLGFYLVLGAITLGTAANGILLTLSEEIGWRGYLYRIWRPAGFWRASLATGFVWGLWHAPAVYLYGHHYPGLGLGGVAVLTAYCILLSPLFTWIRDRGGSVWAAGLLHGGYNATAPLAAASSANAAFPWNGMFGIGGFLVLALLLGLIVLIERWRGARA